MTQPTLDQVTAAIAECKRLGIDVGDAAEALACADDIHEGPDAAWYLRFARDSVCCAVMRWWRAVAYCGLREAAENGDLAALTEALKGVK
jgi:hypothetical protein